MAVPDKPVLLTGASGGIGRNLARAFAARGWDLRLTDIQPFPGEVPAGARFHKADLTDGAAILRLAEGCGTIVHFGGIPVEHPFETVIGPNIRGLYHAYEAARREGARMVYASSNHIAGFHPRSETLDADCAFRPDGYYALSKVYGELMGQLYWDKHQVVSVMLRLGSCPPEPTDDRMLATWISPGDIERLVERSVLAEQGVLADLDRPAVIWGASANARMTWWGADDRERIGWAPQDSADAYAGRLDGVGRGNPVADRFQGGGFCADGYSRRDD